MQLIPNIGRVGDDISTNSQVHTLPRKLEMGEFGLHRMPSEIGTPGELAAPTPANTPINVPFSFEHTAFTPCFMIAPPVFEDKVDVSMSPGQEEEELNANSKTNAGFPAGSSCVQCMETCVQAENKAGEGKTLPLDTAAAMPPSTMEEKDRSCFTEPNVLDINVVQHLEKVKDLLAPLLLPKLMVINLFQCAFLMELASFPEMQLLRILSADCAQISTI